MQKIISEDALRRSLVRMSAEQSKTWLVPQLLGSVQAALGTPWILDIDTTIKPLYGKQSGADVSYNPHKPGRPSHALHTYWVGNLRLVLDVVVSPGKEHSAAKARPGLISVLENLSDQQRPALVRGDCGFGNEPFIAELEDRAQHYLFKLRQTAGVKRLLAHQFARDDWTTPGPSDQGWSAVEDTLKLSGWDKSRRVVILRRAVKTDLALSRKTKNGPGEQIELLMPDKDVQAWEYAVLVTNSSYTLDTFGQLYRDRADCENGFDELKNQWGWGGFTTQDIERCQISARAVALVYNWWSWYSSRQAGREDGGHYQSCTIARQCGASGQTCRTDNAVSHAHARRKRQAARAHRQYPCGTQSCTGCCGAVASDRPLEGVPGLRGGQNHPTAATVAPARPARIGRVTAGFRFMRKTFLAAATQLQYAVNTNNNGPNSRHVSP